MTGRLRACHAFDFEKYGTRYLAEFQYRFNLRFDLRGMLLRLLRAASLTKPHPSTKLRFSELDFIHLPSITNRIYEAIQ